MEILILSGVIAGLSFILLWRENGRRRQINDLRVEILHMQQTLLPEEMRRNRSEIVEALAQRMMDLNQVQKNFQDGFTNQLFTISKSTEDRMERMRDTVEKKLDSLQKDNSDKLEKMRETVDEKLQSTLERRLGESFRQVSERLDTVHKGLGEMQTLATGVGDLKKVLTNVKSRGVLGEIQLRNILEQILTQEQFVVNANVDGNSRTHVEYAVRLPGGDNEVLLPLDSKFPTENYHALVNAYEVGDAEAITKQKKELAKAIKTAAKDIFEKYIHPPTTTDFAIMFLPFEGLYAEVLSQPGLFESIQREQRVIITGPTTISAILNSLQMGFRTLAIEKRTSDVWQLLGSVQKEFEQFGGLLAKTKKKLTEAGNAIEDAETKTRTIVKKLKKVEQIPDTNGKVLYGTGLFDTH